MHFCPATFPASEAEQRNDSNTCVRALGKSWRCPDKRDWAGIPNRSSYPTPQVAPNPQLVARPPWSWRILPAGPASSAQAESDPYPSGDPKATRAWRGYPKISPEAFRPWWKGSLHQPHFQPLPTSSRAREARRSLDHQGQERGRQGQLARFVLGLYSHRDTWQLTLDKMSNKNRP